MSDSAAGSVSTSPNGRPPRELLRLALCNVPSRRVRWLWPGRLPLGAIVVVDGPPGRGKSTILLDVAARGSRGRPMPDGERGDVGTPWDTCLLSYEDSPAHTLRPRAEAAGADLSRIYVVQGTQCGAEGDVLPASLPTDLHALERALESQPDVRLVVIDPLMAALHGDIDAHRDQDVRRVLAHLARIAQQYDVCIVLVRHLRKSSGGGAIVAGGGSIGIIAQARAGLVVGPSPDDEGTSVLAATKANLSALAPSIAYRIVPVTLHPPAGDAVETSRVEWLDGTVSVTADELVAATQDGGTSASESRDAADWLSDVLAAGPVERKAVISAAHDAGYSRPTVDRAAARLNVTKDRTGFGPAMRAVWSLPRASPGALSPVGSRDESVCESTVRERTDGAEQQDMAI